MPVEIFVGDSDKLTPKRHSRSLAEALPHATLHVIERTRHMLTEERPHLVTEGDRPAAAGRNRRPGGRLRNR